MKLEMFVSGATISWWLWLLLKFRPKKKSYDSYLSEHWVVEWKSLFGKYYILGYYQVGITLPRSVSGVILSGCSFGNEGGIEL